MIGFILLVLFLVFLVFIAYGKGKTCLELYNPETKTFELIAEIAPQRLTTNSILLENDSVLIVGGDDLKKSILIFNYQNYKKYLIKP